ncbi:MAG: helix-turn-helix transcriptional regulator [Oscillospiraceae bacterium]|nr:helix-turn-helix transcriptional regulator [Oscillospiraceae bacterium]
MNLKELREKNKLTQAAFGSSLGVSGKAIYLIESGNMNLSRKLSDKIAEVYGEFIEPTGRRAKAAAARAEKKADAIAADAAQAVLDAEKKVDKGKRKAKAKVQADKPAVEAVAEAVTAPVEAVAEAVAAPVEAAVEKKARKRAAKPAMSVVIQSPMGGEITPEEICARIGQADAVYIRVDQNKAYWVRGEEHGEIDLW